MISEIPRRLLRALLPTGAFRGLSGAADYVAAYWQLPPAEVTGLFRILHQQETDPSKDTLELHPRRLRYPIVLRKRSQDARSFLGTCIRSEYLPLLPQTPPSYIVDAGAYVGDFSALVLSRYPDANLVALEPQPDSHEVARTNLRPYRRGGIVEAWHAALWSRNEDVDIEGDGTGARVTKAGAGARVQGLSMYQVMELASFPRLDLFKCDIEGAEEIVFGADAAGWLSRTGTVLIELHGGAAEMR